MKRIEYLSNEGRPLDQLENDEDVLSSLYVLLTLFADQAQGWDRCSAANSADEMIE